MLGSPGPELVPSQPWGQPAFHSEHNIYDNVEWHDPCARVVLMLPTIFYVLCLTLAFLPNTCYHHCDAYLVLPPSFFCASCFFTHRVAKICVKEVDNKFVTQPLLCTTEVSDSRGSMKETFSTTILWKIERLSSIESSQFIFYKFVYGSC